VGADKVPDAKTMGRWGVAIGPQVRKQIHERIVKIAQEKGVTTGRRMRVDTTVVETNIHYIAIVALARKLLVALWRYLETGLIPTGAMFKAR
jgi:hypothetical protein